MPTSDTYPKARIDALTDAVFGVAMTILVLDLRLPDRFSPADQAALAQALHGLLPNFLTYVLSFYVLGSSWLSNIKLRSHGEFVKSRYAFWWLIYLLLATCLPFSTSVVGRFAHFGPSVWLYSLNMAALAASGYLLVVLTPQLDNDEHALDRKVSLLVLIATSALCVGLSLIRPSEALWVYALNVGASPLARWIGAKRANPAKQSSRR
jgi:uncharacterized membrane protein